MGMSTRVTGVRDLDGEFAKMMQVKTACDSAGVDYPQSVKDYFPYEARESEECLRLEMETINIKGAVTEWADDSTSGYVVDLSRLPKDVKSIRFKNGW